MKLIIPVFTLLCVLAACASKEEREADAKSKAAEAAVTPVRSGDTYTFKTWPTADHSYSLQLPGVTKTSCHLGPDFTVHYFTFADSGSLALYNGGHPQSEADQPAERFESAFGAQPARWSLSQEAGRVRAAAYVAEPGQEDGPGSVWHLMVSGTTEKQVRLIVDQLSTFRKVSSAQSPTQKP